MFPQKSSACCCICGISCVAVLLVASFLTGCSLESDASPPSVTLLDEGFLEGIRLGEPFRVHFRADDETRVESVSVEIRPQHAAPQGGRIDFVRFYNLERSHTMIVDTLIIIDELPTPRVTDAVFVGLDADDGSNRRGLSFLVPVGQATGR